MKKISKFLLVLMVLAISVYGEVLAAGVGEIRNRLPDDFGKIKVSYVGGEAYFKRGAVSQRITFGTEIRPGDVIETRQRSFVALLFDDGSVHKVTANTVYEIKDYKNDNESRFQVFNIIKGKIFSFVNKTVKKSDIKFLTPTAVVGVRGTSFVTEVDDVSTTVYLLEGKVEIRNLLDNSTIPLNQGEKGNVRSGTTEKETMNQKDYEQSTKDVPVSLGSVNFGDADGAEAQGATQTKAEEKASVRNLVNEATDKVDRLKQQINENKVWDHQSQKTVGDYRVTQMVKKLAPNKISLVTHTYQISKGRQNSLDLGITFQGNIPGVDSVQTRSSRNVEEMEWNISVSQDAATDRLYYSEKNDGATRSVRFNEQDGVGLKVNHAYKFADANVNLPGKISFEIGGQAYSFDFSYNYVDAQNDNEVGIDGNPFGSGKEGETVRGVYSDMLNGGTDYNTRITITPKVLGKEAKVFTLDTKDKNNEFVIIVLNDFIFPLFTSTVSL